MALRHAILSALSRGVPRTGYDLNSSFADDVDRAWHASPSQVYSELTKMESKGLIDISERNERGRTSYVINEAGVEELRRWLLRDEPDHGIRDDAMMRLLTLWVLDDTNAGYLIDAEISFQRRRQLSLKHMLDSWDEVREDTRVWRNRHAMHWLWLHQTQEMLTWLEDFREILENPELSVRDVFAKYVASSDAAVSASVDKV